MLNFSELKNLDSAILDVRRTINNNYQRAEENIGISG
jgi:hypothetical protein